MAEKTPGARQKPAKPRKPAPKAGSGEPVLLSGGNPQIAKGYGDAPVQRMPACSHTGTPDGLEGFCHFTVSTTSGSAA